MNSALPLKTSALTRNVHQPNVLKVIDFKTFIENGQFGHEFCLLLGTDDVNAENILALGWGGIIYPKEKKPPDESDLPVIYGLKYPDVVTVGDIISVLESRIDILFRKQSNSNMLFVTEQCNHRCIMCSQPPREEDDSWRIDECKAIVDLIDDSDNLVLGISGGEPSLLGSKLVDIIKHCKVSIPKTSLHILTNGTIFSDKKEVQRISNLLHDKIVWGIPLFGSTPQQHDFHTQVSGSFDRTIHGLYNLALSNQVIELRVVLTRMVIENIEAISEFIVRNLPFVQTVALMGVEPTGYARVNYQSVWCEIADYAIDLKRSVNYMQSCSLNVQLYNLPLCILPEELHGIAAQSISDWKNIYHDECATCLKKDQCCGFFQSVNARFVKKDVIPFIEDVKLGIRNETKYS